MAIIDRNNQASESNESDADNMRSTVLPNLVALPPTVSGTGDVSVGYRVATKALSRSSESLALYWSNSETLGGSVKLIKSVPIHAGVTGEKWIPKILTRKDLDRSPSGMPFVLVRMDPDENLLESTKNDNVSVLKIPDINLTKAKTSWPGGSLEILPKLINKASIPAGRGVSKLYWANGEGKAAAIQGIPPIATFDASASTLRVPREKLLAPPDGATHLLLVADETSSVAELRENNNVLAIRLLPARLSLTSPGGSKEIDMLEMGKVQVGNERSLRFEIRNTGAPHTTLYYELPPSLKTFGFTVSGRDPSNGGEQLGGGQGVLVTVRYAPRTDASVRLDGSYRAKVTESFPIRFRTYGGNRELESAGEKSIQLSAVYEEAAVTFRYFHAKKYTVKGADAHPVYLRVDNYIGSTSGDVRPLIARGLLVREVLSVKGRDSSGPYFRPPKPFNQKVWVGTASVWGTNPLLDWAPLVDAFGDKRRFIDYHGLTGLAPRRLDLKSLQNASFTLVQSYQYRIARSPEESLTAMSTDSAEKLWKPFATFEIKRSIERRDGQWNYVVEKKLAGNPHRGSAMAIAMRDLVASYKTSN